MKYKNIEIDIADTNYVEGAATVSLPTGEIVCIPEQDATLEELDIIRQIKEDVALRPVLEIVPSVPMPTTEERLASTEAAILALMEVRE